MPTPLNPPSGRLILPADSAAHTILASAAQHRKVVIFAGLPGVGKSLMLQQMALLSHAAGRRLTLLQWDVARQAFEMPSILERYPEVGGSTHPAIRKAAGLWVRAAVAAWSAAHAGDDALLLGEAPLVGNRLIELARREADEAEPALAAATTEFIVPVPTLAVRRAIEGAREREMQRPRHARETANAPPAVMALLMEDLRAAGTALGIPAAAPPDGAAGRGYDPDVYAACYARLLAQRHTTLLPIDECWTVAASPYDLAVTAAELQPTPSEVRDAMARVDALEPALLERQVRQWFLPA